MITDEERWAEAVMVQRLHGDVAREHVIERIIALTLEGDKAGVARWQEIGERVEQLAAGTVQ